MIKYTITDNHGSYIRYDELSRKYVPIKNKNFASTWDDRAKAKNVLNNCVPGNLRQKYKVKEIKDALKKKNDQEKPKKEFPIQEVKRVSNLEIYNSNAQEWEEGLKKVESFVVNADERRKELTEKLSNVDKEISDIQHYIEFNRLNAYQGWVVMSMLKNRLQQRREYKDELFLLSRIHKCSLSKKEIEEAREASAQNKNRQYTPRVLTELF